MLQKVTIQAIKITGGSALILVYLCIELPRNVAYVPALFFYLSDAAQCSVQGNHCRLRKHLKNLGGF
jgi:hypothetical protein